MERPSLNLVVDIVNHGGRILFNLGDIMADKIVFYVVVVGSVVAHFFGI